MKASWIQPLGEERGLHGFHGWSFLLAFPTIGMAVGKRYYLLVPQEGSSILPPPKFWFEFTAEDCSARGRRSKVTLLPCPA